MTTRRAILGTLTSMAISVRCYSDTPAGTSSLQDKSYSDGAQADKWMQNWIQSQQQKDPSSSKGPNGAMYVGRFADPVYYLLSVIGWDPNASQATQYHSVHVPVGFVTDFASIPRIFWSALRPDGLYAYAAVVHDYLYWEQYLSREMSDQILKYCMEDFRIDSATITAVYEAVRLGGALAWRSNARLKASGERRILKRVPTDPTIRWNDWKSLPDVF